MSAVSNSEEEIFVLAPGFRGLRPLPGGPVAFGSVSPLSITERGHTKQSCLPHGFQEAKGQRKRRVGILHLLQGHFSTELASFQ